MISTCINQQYGDYFVLKKTTTTTTKQKTKNQQQQEFARSIAQKHFVPEGVY